MADKPYDKRDLERRGDHLYTASGSGSTPYTVDTREEHCTCMAFAMNRNKHDNPWCKHLTAAFDLEGRPQSVASRKMGAGTKRSPVQSNPVKPKAVKAPTPAERRAQEEEQEKAAMDFQKIRMREQLRRELEALREDV